MVINSTRKILLLCRAKNEGGGGGGRCKYSPLSLWPRQDFENLDGPKCILEISHYVKSYSSVKFGGLDVHVYLFGLNDERNISQQDLAQ